MDTASQIEQRAVAALRAVKRQLADVQDRYQQLADQQARARVKIAELRKTESAKEAAREVHTETVSNELSGDGSAAAVAQAEQAFQAAKTRADAAASLIPGVEAAITSLDAQMAPLAKQAQALVEQAKHFSYYVIREQLEQLVPGYLGALQSAANKYAELCAMARLAQPFIDLGMGRNWLMPERKLNTGISAPAINLPSLSEKTSPAITEADVERHTAAAQARLAGLGVVL